MAELLNIQELLAEKLRSLARNTPYQPSPLQLTVVKSNPLQLSDSNGLILKHDSDYQSKLKSLEADDKVIVENYDAHLKIDKFEVINIKIQIKELNYKGKKIGGLDIVFQVDNTGGRLLNESGRNFINRLRKAQSANKFSDVQFVTLVSDHDQKDLIKQRKAKSIVPLLQMQEQKQQLVLDQPSQKLLKKLKTIINKTDLFNLLVKQGVKDSDSKRTIRQMIFPDLHVKGNKDPLAFEKKTFSRNLVQGLIEQYKN